MKTDITIAGVKITNPEKILFPKSKITKLDLAKYYEQVAPRMLPYLENRIISTIRCPKGISLSCFFKKHLGTKDLGLKLIELPKKGDKLNDYYYITKVSGIISEVQMNTVEFHIWGSRVDNLNAPNMMVFDLDPDVGMNISQVRRGVKDLKQILDGLKLKSFLKTSGGKGYHVVVPFKEDCNWDKFKDFAKNIALLMESTRPDLYTTNVRIKNRKNRIFIDWIRNTKSATSIAPYSVRIKDQASVSMPIKWSELDTITPDGITINDALKRIKLKDPWVNFFNIDQKIN